MTIGLDGSVYVTSDNGGGANASIKRFDAETGVFVGDFVTPGSGGLSQPREALFGPDGNLYVVEQFGGSPIRRYHGTTGAYLGNFVAAGSGGINDCVSFAFGADGNIYASSGSTASIKKYSGATGAFLGDFVASGGGGLTSPKHLVFGADGNLYVVNYTSISPAASSVKRFNGATGTYLGDFVTPGSGGLTEAFDITFGPDNNLYVLKAGGIPSGGVWRYNGATGAFIDQFVLPGAGAQSEPRGMLFLPPAAPVDTTLPTITINSPVATTYVLNQGVIADYTATDSESGIASTSGTVADGAQIDTNSVGTKTFTVTTMDNAGNTATKTVTYSVGYAVKALFDQTRAHKSGSTIPIKVQLCDANGVNYSSAATVVQATGVVLVTSNAPGALEDSGNANPDANFRYDADLLGYIFNLRTSGYGTGTYRLNFTAGSDPTQHSVEFQIR